MNIGLDVDGVLVDTQTFQLREGKKYFGKKYGISAKNPDMFEVMDVFECTKKQREAFWILLYLEVLPEGTDDKRCSQSCKSVEKGRAPSCYHNKPSAYNRKRCYR